MTVVRSSRLGLSTMLDELCYRCECVFMLLGMGIMMIISLTNMHLGKKKTVKLPF